MMDKFKGRVGIPGHKELGPILNESAHGEMVASRRYGGGTRHPDMGPVPSNKPQKLGDANNQQGNYYDNDTRKDWRVGFGKGGAESAEGKPSYVPNFRAPD